MPATLPPRCHKASQFLAIGPQGNGATGKENPAKTVRTFTPRVSLGFLRTGMQRHTTDVRRQNQMRKCIVSLATLVLSLGLLVFVSPSQAQFFTYSVTYTDPMGSVSFPGMTTVGSESPTTFLN